MTEQARRVDDVRDAIRHLEERLDGCFQAIEGRFQTIEGRFQAVDYRLTALDQKLDTHFVAIDAKMSRLTTLQVGTLLAVVAALAGMLSDLTR
jgi:hypothetical protein